MVLATEEETEVHLYDEQCLHKVEPITKHIGLVYSGMGPDYRYLVSPSVNSLFSILWEGKTRDVFLCRLPACFCSVEQQQLKLVICQYEADWGLLEGELSAPHLLKRRWIQYLALSSLLLFCRQGTNNTCYNKLYFKKVYQTAKESILSRVNHILFISVFSERTEFSKRPLEVVEYDSQLGSRHLCSLFFNIHRKRVIWFIRVPASF